MPKTQQTRRVEVGDIFDVKLPWSEVCMAMRVADKVMTAQLVSEWAVQLYDEDGRKFSYPITRGEAGVYDNGKGLFINVPNEG